MKDLKSQLLEIMSSISVEQDIYESSIPGVFCIKNSQTSPYSRRRWRSCLAIVAQGCKEIILEQNTYYCSEAHYTATPIDFPVISRIAEASSEKPFLAILIDLDPLILSEVAMQLNRDILSENVNQLRAFFIGKANDKILESTIRLAKLFQTPEDASVLGPLIIKEIIYHLLKGPNGEGIMQFVRSGSKMHNIFQVIYKLKSELNKEIDITHLAKEANMSRSAFFKYFNEVTAMSPIQYQKRLRLLEAKRLMLEEKETAESSAFKVGYKSTSQFSREYSRMFGSSPIRDVMKVKYSDRLVNSESLG